MTETTSTTTTVSATMPILKPGKLLYKQKNRPAASLVWAQADFHHNHGVMLSVRTHSYGSTLNRAEVEELRDFLTAWLDAHTRAERDESVR